MNLEDYKNAVLSFVSCQRLIKHAEESEHLTRETKGTIISVTEDQRFKAARRIQQIEEHYELKEKTSG